MRSEELNASIEAFLIQIGIDVNAAKKSFETGDSYHFEFGETQCYIGLPLSVPGRLGSARFEFLVFDVSCEAAGKILYLISLDLDANRQVPLRAVVRPKSRIESTVLLQYVADAEAVRDWYVGVLLSDGLELAEFYRQEFGLKVKTNRLAS